MRISAFNRSCERKQSHIYPSRSLKKVAIRFDHDPILFSTANPADEVFGRHKGENFARKCLTAAQFSSTPSGFWSFRSVEDPWTPAICGMNWILSTEGEASRMDFATAISFGSLAEVTNMGIETCAAAFRTVDGPRKCSPGEN